MKNIFLASLLSLALVIPNGSALAYGYYGSGFGSGADYSSNKKVIYGYSDQSKRPKKSAITRPPRKEPQPVSKALTAKNSYPIHGYGFSNYGYSYNNYGRNGY